MLILLLVILTFAQLTYEDHSSIVLIFISHQIVDQLMILISGFIMLTSYLIIIQFQLVVSMPLFLTLIFLKVTLFILSKNLSCFEGFDTFHSIIQYPTSKIILLTLITQSNLLVTNKMNIITQPFFQDFITSIGLSQFLSKSTTSIIPQHFYQSHPLKHYLLVMSSSSFFLS